MSFINDQFMLTNEYAKKLYPYTAEQPIFDYHCHLNPEDIFNNDPFENIVDLWLSGDHYKWRLMRANGIAEKYITGDASDIEKFKAWSETLSRAFGNPLYHWSHLEMYQVFGIDEALTMENWERLYDEMNHQIKDRELSPRHLIQSANVKFIGTTDSPLDTLEWHQKISQDPDIDFVVAPSFRPDEAFIQHIGFIDFLEKLETITNKKINSFDHFVESMEERIIYFVENGCRASDHSFYQIEFQETDVTTLDCILSKIKRKESVTTVEVNQWQSMLMLRLCEIYKKYDLITQIHFGALRNNNTPAFQRLGSDAGFDSMGDQEKLAIHLNKWLDTLTRKNALPKMIFYNLNPVYNEVVANTIANFQGNEEAIKSKIQFGAAWWFNDSEQGMIHQMNALANQGLLANFVGMLTDSRSFLSYQRHDYFRRILANYVGEWVEQGKVPNDKEMLGNFIADIAYRNAKQYFDKGE